MIMYTLILEFKMLRLGDRQLEVSLGYILRYSVKVRLK